ncbi:MAG: hypothetical protein GY847_27240 [Proteobacteria bacterium]|nr:hypothetical protein [Pseudomonadota bacterium]
MNSKTLNSEKNQSSKRFFYTVGLPAIASVALVAILIFLPSSFAANNDGSASPDSVESQDTSYEASTKLPAEWTWKKEAINFDHMYRSKH